MLDLLGFGPGEDDAAEPGGLRVSHGNFRKRTEIVFDAGGQKIAAIAANQSNPRQASK